MPAISNKHRFERSEVEQSQLLASLEKALEAALSDPVSEIECCSSDGRDRDSTPARPVLVDESSGAMDRQTGASMARDRSCHMERNGTCFEDAQEPRRGPVAQERPRPAAQDGGEAPSVQREARVAYRIDPLMELVQHATADGTVDRRVRIAELPQLSDRNHAVLPRR